MTEPPNCQQSPQAVIETTRTAPAAWRRSQLSWRTFFWSFGGKPRVSWGFTAPQDYLCLPQRNKNIFLLVELVWGGLSSR